MIFSHLTVKSHIPTYWNLIVILLSNSWLQTQLLYASPSSFFFLILFIFLMLVTHFLIKPF